MATGATASTFKTVLGWAREPQPATGTPVASANYAPVRKLDVKNTVVKLLDQSWRGSMVQTTGVQNGPQSASLAVEGDAFPGSITWFLAGILGDIAYTGGTTVGGSTTTSTTLTAGATTTFTVASGTGITVGTVLAIDTAGLLELVTCFTGTTGTTVVLQYPVAKSHSGTVTVQPVSAPFTDAIALYNAGNGQPMSYTVTDSDSLSTRQYASTRFTDLTLSYDASKLLTYQATALSWATQGTTSAPVQSYESYGPAPAWECQASYGGSSNATVQTAEVALKRSGSECIFTLQNTQNPYEVHVGPIEVTTKLVVVAADETWLTDYLANTSKVLTLDLAAGVGAAATEIKIQMSGHNLQSVEKSKGKSYIEFATTGLAVGNTTDVGLSAGYSPCLVTCKNNIPPQTFA